MAVKDSDGTSISETILYVSSPAKSAALYSEALGFSVAYLNPQDWYASMKASSGPARIAFASRAWAEQTHGKNKLQFSTATQARAFGSEVCFGPPGGDVDTAFEKAIKAGFTSFTPPFDTMWGSRMAYVRDIDGHVISFSGRSKEEPKKEESEASTKAAGRGRKGAAAVADKEKEPKKVGVKAVKAASKPELKVARSNTAKTAKRMEEASKAPETKGSRPSRTTTKESSAPSKAKGKGRAK